MKRLAKEAGLLTADTGGLTAGYGVIVRLDCTRNVQLLAHEFVHVAQYERLGREGFLQEYIQQIAAHGYTDALFELEAEAKASNACHVVRLAKCKPAPSKKSRFERVVAVITAWSIRTTSGEASVAPEGSD